jgi:hypothetical protein
MEQQMITLTRLLPLVALTAMLVLAACGDSREMRAGTGALGGGVAGALVGGPVGAVIGGTAGGAGGAALDEGLEDKVD